MAPLTAILFATLLLHDSPPAANTLPAPPEPLRQGFDAIDEADLRAWLGFLASPELEGRMTGEHGFDVAARFCAMQFSRAGLKPLGTDGAYFQEFKLAKSEPDGDASSLEVLDASGADRFGLDAIALADTREIDWSAPWVFAGHGEGADADAPDPFRGIPLGERVVMVLPRPNQKSFESRGALAAGATRVAVISDERVASRRGLEPRLRPEWEPEPPPPGGAEVVYLSQKAADRILARRGASVKALLEQKPPLPRLDLGEGKIHLRLKLKHALVPTRNVAALLEGADPALRDQIVSIGAHLDHVGTHGGKVYPGADDDGSGSSGVLALAKAFAGSSRRPARSVLFLLFAGEEEGLWGSRYWVDHSPIPLKSYFTHLQMDMIGRNEEHPGKEKAEENTNSVHLVGSERHSLDLKRAVLEVNRFVGLDFEYDEEGVYGRSDQINFGDRGIPVCFFFTGFHPDYHQPGDTPDKINYPKMARVLRLVFAAAHELADRQVRLAPVKRL